MAIENLAPKSVFGFFSEISAIPRGSKNERKITDYLLKFAQAHGLWAYRDEHLNVVIRKPASPGYEHVPSIILQAHTDMVCEKDSHVAHDFTKDGIKILVDGEYLRADGTTLGADNGIAVAYCLALLEDHSLAHPPLEVLLTADEEAGMTGASNLNPALLTGRRLINLDSGEEGKFFISCAGGISINLSLPTETIDAPAGYSYFMLRVDGLRGGHSGCDIHKEPGNANCILSRILCALGKYDIYVVDIRGGAKDNAIPREAQAAIFIKDSDCEEASVLVEKLCEDIKTEYRFTDPGAKLSMIRLQNVSSKAYTKEVSRKIAIAGRLLPNGIQRMCKREGFEDLVESSANLGVVNVNDNHVDFHCSLRSSVVSRKYEMEQTVKLVAEVLGAETEKIADYPAWEFNPNSWLQHFFQEEYEKFSGNKPENAAIHAGLECGWFAEILGRPDMISIGPNCIDLHSPAEKVEIASIERVWEFLKHVLANMKE